jgi:hypothetical protein
MKNKKIENILSVLIVGFILDIIIYSLIFLLCLVRYLVFENGIIDMILLYEYIIGLIVCYPISILISLVLNINSE